MSSNVAGTLLIIIIYAGLCLWIGHYAGERGRDPFRWGLFALLALPLTFLILFLLPPGNGSTLRGGLVERPPYAPNWPGIGVGIAGAALLGVSVFLPLLNSTSYRGIYQNTLIQHEGWALLAAAVLVGLLLASASARQAPARIALVFSILALIFVIALAASKSTRTLHALLPSGEVDAEAGTTTGSFGVAIYLAGAGALLASIGSWMARSGATPTAISATATKTCPDCAEAVLADARVCKYCHYRFDDTADEPTIGKRFPTGVD